MSDLLLNVEIDAIFPVHGTTETSSKLPAGESEGAFDDGGPSARCPQARETTGAHDARPRARCMNRQMLLDAQSINRSGCADNHDDPECPVGGD